MLQSNGTPKPRLQVELQGGVPYPHFMRITGPDLLNRSRTGYTPPRVCWALTTLKDKTFLPVSTDLYIVVGGRFGPELVGASAAKSWSRRSLFWKRQRAHEAAVRSAGEGKKMLT